MTTTTRSRRYGVLPWVVVVGALALSSASLPPEARPSASTGSTGTAVSGTAGGSSTCGNCNGNNGNGSGNGGSTGTGSPGHAVNVTGVVSGAIAPGRPAVLNVTIDNPNNQDITVRSVSGRVTSVSTRGLSGLQPCSAAWFSVGSFTGAKVIGRNGSAVVSLPVTLTNLPLVNQDNCKNVSYSFAFTATAEGA